MTTPARSARVATLVLAVAAACALSAPAAAAPPANDAFAAAEALSGRVATSSGNNKDATKEPGEPDHAGRSGGASVWYKWTAPADGAAVVSTCETAVLDTLLAVYTGDSVDALDKVEANDDSCGLQSEVSFDAEQGVTYRIAVDGVGGATGEIELQLVLRPPNDDFASAQVLTGDTGRVEGSNEGSSIELEEPDLGWGSVWYRWTAPSTGPATFETCGSSFDAFLSVFTGPTLQDLLWVAADYDECGAAIRVHFDAVEGTVYHIAVSSWSEESGDVVLAWDRSPGPPQPPYSDESPSISGIARDGDTLTGSEGTWFGTPPLSFAYAWLRCDESFDRCAFVNGAAGRTYTLGADDVGKRLFLRVTATNVAGSDYAYSMPTAVVRPGAPINSSIPGVSGSARVGSVLSASPGTWRGASPMQFAYHWQACDAAAACVDLPGQTDSSLRADASTVGRRLRVVVTATNVEGSATAVSAPTGVVARAARVVRRCVVPNVKGKPLAAARRAIRRAGCTTGRIRRSYSASVRSGRVIAQAPRPGARKPARAKVSLVLSKGQRR
jgi:hypothetical protein